MQATLIYNSNAGNTSQITVDVLQEALQKAGYYPVYKATSCEADLDPALDDAEGLVVTAGGDGTIRAVATRLIGRDVPLAIIPLGTANNISRALGVTAEPLAIIAGLKNPTQCRFDVGHVQAPWGQDYFLEGAGYGLYADTLALYDPEQGKSILRGIDAIRQTLADYQVYRTEMKLDGREISGDYLLAEMMNTQAIGPRLKLAPDAVPTDGLLEVVCVDEAVREQFMRFAVSFLSENLAEMPAVALERGRKVEIAWAGFPIHVDGEVRPKLEEMPGERLADRDARLRILDALGDPISIEVLPQAIEFWLPAVEGVEGNGELA